MKNTSKVYNLFSKVFYTNIIDDISLAPIAKYLDKEEFKKVGYGVANQTLKTSTSIGSTHNVLDLKRFKKLKERLLQEFYYFKNEYLKYTNNDFVITTSWITKSAPGETSHIHNHRNCFYSGIFYLQVPPNSGEICFENYLETNYIKLLASEYNIHNSSHYTMMPRNGTILFFPSMIHHRILTNNSAEVRYSLAFNLMPKGKAGEWDSFYEFN
tara:strand:- start:5570 stop:6208 length:639 start_codon:yes stop_codon:yes gene_type:complete